MRSIMIKSGDPDVQMNIRGCDLLMPLSHELPLYRALNPYYDTVLLRLRRHLSKADVGLVSIDVGANIGDTVVDLYENEADTCYAFEPSMRFFEYLQKNWSECEGVHCINLACGSETSQVLYGRGESKGTASYSTVGVQGEIWGVSLDAYFCDRISLEVLNIVKIDTDGYDLEVLRGGMRTIEKYKPYILFEYDPFDNEDYLQQFSDLAGWLIRAGYSHMITYTNKGNLMDLVRLSDADYFARLHSMITTSTGFYSDVLLLPEEDNCRFWEKESAVFVESGASQSLYDNINSSFAS